MAIRKRGRSVIAVDGRLFVWHVHAETHVRIASVDKRFVVAYRWTGEPELSVHGPEFPGLDPDEPRPIRLQPPRFDFTGPAALARQVVRWAFSPGDRRASVTKY